MPDDRELILERTLNAPRAAVWRCWTEPELLKQWFAPKPWTTPTAELDVRPGGACLIVMQSPEAQEERCPGVYLEVVPQQKLVFTDAYVRPWEPSGKPFMTAVITLADAGAGKTAYTARVLHWTAEDREEHERMGFYEGWGKCAEQLEAVAAGVAGA